jgi:hypothetical protein
MFNRSPLCGRLLHRSSSRRTKSNPTGLDMFMERICCDSLVDHYERSAPFRPPHYTH